MAFLGITIGSDVDPNNYKGKVRTRVHRQTHIQRGKAWGQAENFARHQRLHHEDEVAILDEKCERQREEKIALANVRNGNTKHEQMRTQQRRNGNSNKRAPKRQAKPTARRRATAKAA